ncbi:MAG TPA: alpha/beta hydrolase [Polyangium sp.]|nr:alpha/beta hydrolase [Polyangium sp.]
MQSGSGLVFVNGIRLYIHRFQPASARPSGLTVLLLHGYLDSGATWDLVAEPLARAGHDVLAPDLRGFGESDSVGAGGYYHFPDYVSDLSSLLDILAPKRLALVGHSMGGTIAALFAGARPQRVDQLVLLEGLGAPGSEPSTAVDRMRTWLDDMRSLDRTPRPVGSFDEALDRLARRHPQVSRMILESRARLLTRTHSGRLSWAYDSMHRTTAPVPFHLESFKCFLRRITAPTLYVSGGVNGLRLHDEAERLACIPNTLHVDLPDAGHMMHWTAPETLTERLLRFFASPPENRPAPPR